MRSLANERDGDLRYRAWIWDETFVDLHTELPIMSWREIAEVCYIRYARRPVSAILTEKFQNILSPSRFHQLTIANVEAALYSFLELSSIWRN